MSNVDGKLKILWPVTITSSDNKFAITINSVQYQITMAAGTYYAYFQDDYTTLPAGFTTTYPSLYQAIIDAAEAGIAGSTWTVGSVTPVESSSQTRKGLQWRLSPDTFAFTLDFSDATDWTMDPRLWGYPEGHTTDETSSDTGSLQTLDSDYTYLGAWQPPRKQTDFRGPLERMVQYSTDQVERADAYAVDYGTRKTRGWAWEYIGAAHVYAQRAEEAAYATNGDLATGDTNNALEHAFPEMARLEELIVVPIADATDVHLGIDHTESWVSGAADQVWEICRLDVRNVSSPVSMDDFLTLRRAGGEFYDIRIPLVQVDGGGSTYDA